MVFFQHPALTTKVDGQVLPAWHFPTIWLTSDNVVSVSFRLTNWFMGENFFPEAAEFITCELGTSANFSYMQ